MWAEHILVSGGLRNFDHSAALREERIVTKTVGPRFCAVSEWSRLLSEFMTLVKR